MNNDTLKKMYDQQIQSLIKTPPRVLQGKPSSYLKQKQANIKQKINANLTPENQIGDTTAKAIHFFINKPNSQLIHSKTESGKDRIVIQQSEQLFNNLQGQAIQFRHPSVDFSKDGILRTYQYTACNGAKYVQIMPGSQVQQFQEPGAIINKSEIGVVCNNGISIDTVEDIRLNQQHMNVGIPGIQYVNAESTKFQQPNQLYGPRELRSYIENKL